MLWLLLLIGEAIFSEVSNQYLDPIAKAIGGKLLLLICLLLLCGILSLAWISWPLLKTKTQEARELAEIPQTPTQDIRGAVEHIPTEKEIHDARIRLLENLSGGEKRMLKRYFEKDTKSQMFHISDGGAAGLARKGILFYPTPAGYGVEIALNIHEWAWETLKDNPKYLL